MFCINEVSEIDSESIKTRGGREGKWRAEAAPMSAATQKGKLF